MHLSKLFLVLFFSSINIFSSDIKFIKQAKMLLREKEGFSQKDQLVLARLLEIQSLVPTENLAKECEVCLSNDSINVHIHTYCRVILANIQRYICNNLDEKEKLESFRLAMLAQSNFKQAASQLYTSIYFIKELSRFIMASSSLCKDRFSKLIAVNVSRR